MSKVASRAVYVCVFVLLLAAAGLAQTTTATGSIQGTVTDPAGAVVPGANVTITGRATGQVIKTTTSGSGSYASGALIPGEYQVKVVTQGFRTAAVNLDVRTTERESSMKT